MGSALFWYITQRWMVVLYRRFGAHTTVIFILTAVRNSNRISVAVFSDYQQLLGFYQKWCVNQCGYCLSCYRESVIRIVDTLWPGRPTIRVSVSVRNKTVFSSPKPPDRLYNPSSLIPNSYRGCFSPDVGADHSSESSVEAKNQWNLISTTPYWLQLQFWPLFFSELNCVVLIFGV
jgi:hypothetical protein